MGEGKDSPWEQPRQQLQREKCRSPWKRCVRRKEAGVEQRGNAGTRAWLPALGPAAAPLFATRQPLPRRGARSWVGSAHSAWSCPKFGWQPLCPAPAQSPSCIFPFYPPPPPPPLRKTKPESGSCGDQPQSLTVGFCNEMANRGRHRDNPRLSPSCRHRGGRVALCWGCGAGKNWEVTLGGSRVLRELPRLPH